MSDTTTKPEAASIIALGADWYRVEIPGADGIPCHIEAPSLESAQRVARMNVVQWERDRAVDLLSDLESRFVELQRLGHIEPEEWQREKEVTRFLDEIEGGDRGR